MYILIRRIYIQKPLPNTLTFYEKRHIKYLLFRGYFKINFNIFFRTNIKINNYLILIFT